MSDSPEIENNNPEVSGEKVSAYATDASVLLDAYKQVLVWHFIATFLIIFLLVLIVAIYNSIFGAVILSGCLGAFFSALTRLYSFETLPKALLDSAPVKIRNWHLLFYSLIPPLIGAIAAAVLYLVFAGEFITSNLFPSFISKQSICADIDCLTDGFGPAKAKDYAKSLVWGFVAGFSERLVPDTILLIQTKGNKE